MMPMSHPPFPSSPSPGLLVDTAGRVLPLESVHARVDAEGGLARLVLRQRFANPHDVPLEVTYSLPLPAEAAVSGFSFLIGARRVVGEIDKKASARERYEDALAHGHTAALVEQDRDTLFSQAIGNVPPGAAVEAEIVVDMKLRFLDEGRWELRLPMTVAPRYLGETGRVVDAARIAQDVAAQPMPVRLTLDARIRGLASDSAKIESTTHAIAAARSASGEIVARFAEETGAPLDRDVVLRWVAATPTTAVAARTTRPRGAASAYALLTITPPQAAARDAALARDLVLLLDTSGSMGGLPIEQAKRISLALVESLGASDTLEMIAFSSAPRRFKRSAETMTAKNRAAAVAWLSSLEASGGTEMREAIVEALRPLREGAQRQVVLVTDGLIGFETEIVRTILESLPAQSRVHTVGVGSGINRTLTAGAARAGRGIEVIADSHEDPERVAARIVARTHAPLVTNVQVRGAALRSTASARIPDLFAGAPVLVAAEMDPNGGVLTVEGETAHGPYRAEINVAPCGEGEGLAAIEQLFARERAADLEMRAAAGENVDAALEALGLAHRIATRMTSWIAVSEEKTVDPNAPFRRERMPHELPHGSSPEGFGLRPPMMALGAMQAAAPMMAMRSRAVSGGAPPLGRASAPTGAPPPPAPAMPARAPAPKKESEGEARSLVRRVLAPLFQRGGGAEKSRAKGGALRVLRGRIALRRGRALVVVVSVDAAWAWNAPATVEVVLADGERRTAKVVTAPSAATLAAGVEIRLVLDVEDGTDGDLAAIELEGASIALDAP